MLEHFIVHFGYLALFVGTFFEGETILILGGFLAHRGYLQLPGVILFAFLGTLTGDYLYFFLGRSRGEAFLKKRPAWRNKTERIFSLIHKNKYILMLGFRFLYGIRTVTPFVLGMSGINTFSFICMNFLGASVWAISFGVLGYLFGQTMEIIIKDIERYEFWVMSGIALIGFLVFIVRRYRNQTMRDQRE